LLVVAGAKGWLNDDLPLFVAKLGLVEVTGRQAVRHEERLAAESRLDGCYVLRTDLLPTEVSAPLNPRPI
jgi:hypothetical protein